MRDITIQDKVISYLDVDGSCVLCFIHHSNSCAKTKFGTLGLSSISSHSLPIPLLIMYLMLLMKRNLHYTQLHCLWIATWISIQCWKAKQVLCFSAISNKFFLNIDRYIQKDPLMPQTMSWDSLLFKSLRNIFTRFSRLNESWVGQLQTSLEDPEPACLTSCPWNWILYVTYRNKNTRAKIKS